MIIQQFVLAGLTKPPKSAFPLPTFSIYTALQTHTMAMKAGSLGNLTPELVINIAEMLDVRKVSEHRSNLRALMLVSRRFFEVVAPVLYKNIRLDLNVEKLANLRFSAQAYLFEHTTELGLVSSVGAEALLTDRELRRALRQFFDIFRMCSNVKKLMFCINAPLDWRVISQSKLEHLDLGVHGLKTLAGSKAIKKVSLPASMKTMEVTSYFGERYGPDLSSVFDLVARTDSLNSWTFEPYSPDYTGLYRFPAAVDKLRSLSTFSRNELLLSDLTLMPEFAPETLKVCAVDEEDWNRISRLKSVKHLFFHDSFTEILSWGLPPMLESIELMRPRATLPEESYAALRNKLRDVKVRIHGGLREASVVLQQWAPPQHAKELVELWAQLSNVTFTN